MATRVQPPIQLQNISTMSGPPGYAEVGINRDQAVSQHQQLPQGGPVVNYVPQPQGMSGLVYQVPYYVPSVWQAGTAIRQPGYPGPSDFLVLALTTLILCGLLNITSLFMSIPALIFASLSNHQLTVRNNYKMAKRYSDITIGLVIATILWTLIWAVIITGIIVGDVYRIGINGHYVCSYGYPYYC